MTLTNEWVVMLWHRPYRAAATLKGPFENEQAAFELAVRLVIQEQQYDMATLHRLSEPTAEIANDETQQPTDEQAEAAAGMDDDLEDANVDANEG